MSQPQALGAMPAPAAAPASGGKKYVSSGNSTVDGLGMFESNGTQFFAPGVTGKTPSEKFTLNGRILPAFDPNLIGKPEHPTSFIPYRVCKVNQVTSGDQMDARNVPRTTNWFVGMMGYRMFDVGGTRHDITSPMTKKVYPGFGQSTPDDLADPFIDIINYLKKRFAKDKPSLEFYTEAPGKNQSPIVPHPKTMVVCNMWGRVGNEAQASGLTQNFLGFCTNTGWNNLLDRLAYPTLYSTQPRDPNFPEFLFGDITDPATGLYSWGAKVQSGETTPWSWIFSAGPNTLEKSVVTPVNETVLRQRHALDHTLFNILSYQEIVDLIVAAASIPYEFVAAACSHRATVKPYKETTATYSMGSAAATPPSGPGGVPEGPKYYAGVGSVVDPAPMPLMALPAYAAAHPGAMFTVMGTNNWQTLEQITGAMLPTPPAAQLPPAPGAPGGFSAPAAPQGGFSAPTAPSAPPTAPSAPPTAPTPPVATPPPAAPQPPAAPPAALQPPVAPPQPPAAPPAAPQPPAAPPAAPQPPADTRQFWVFAGGAVRDLAVDAAAARQIAANDPKAQFMLDGEQAWQKPDAYGLAAPAPAGGAAAPAGGTGWTETDEKRYTELSNILNTPGAQPDMDMAAELVELERRRSAK